MTLPKSIGSSKRWLSLSCAVLITGVALAILPGVVGGSKAKAETITTITCKDGTTRQVAPSDEDNLEGLCATGGGVKEGATTQATDTSKELKCDTGYKLLGIIPTWYEYFGTDYGVVKSDNPFIPDSCGVTGGDVSDHIVQVGLAVVDILLRVGALAAVAFIIMGGYRYMSSQGEPKNIEAAMATIVNAAIGLGIVVTATVIVAFIGHSLGG